VKTVFSIGSQIYVRVSYLLSHWWKQEWHDGNRSNGYLPRGPHYSIHRRWHNTCILPHKCSGLIGIDSSKKKKRVLEEGTMVSVNADGGNSCSIECNINF
jgi:hypothetical protein